MRIRNDGVTRVLVLPGRGYAMVLMVLSSTAISFGGLIIRSMEAADPWQINFYRALSLVVAVGLILLFQYRRRTAFQVRKIGGAGLLGGAMLAVAAIALVQSFTHTTVANTLFTLSAIPFITAALARVVLKETLRRVTLAAMAVAAAGILIMTAEGIGIGSIYGNAMALLTAVCFSAFAVIVRRRREVDMLPTLLVSGVLIALAAFAARFDDLGVTLNDLLLCLLWGGVLSGFANWTFIIAARRLVAAEVTLFMLLEFSLGPIWVWLFVAEVPSAWTLLGGALIIAAVSGLAIHELRRGRTSGSGPAP